MRLDPKRILIGVGTRPEAIKVAPLLRDSRGTKPQERVEVCVTPLHGELLDSVLQHFPSLPGIDLALMSPNGVLIVNRSDFAAIRPDQLKGKSVINACGWQQ